MRTAICLGGGSTLDEDIERLPIPFDGVVACNDAGAYYPGGLDAWVSLHPKKFPAWEKKRKSNGYPECPRFFAHAKNGDFEKAEPTPYVFTGMTGSGSSGLFAAKVAIENLGFDRVVLCGIPMMAVPHFFDENAWRSAAHFRKHWKTMGDNYRKRLRSMSGWSRVFLGGPEDWA